SVPGSDAVRSFARGATAAACRQDGALRRRPEMSDSPALPAGYRPPDVWQWQQPSGGSFASINRPVSGPTHEKELPVGRHPLQLYSLGTPNGVKVTIM